MKYPNKIMKKKTWVLKKRWLQYVRFEKNYNIFQMTRFNHSVTFFVVVFAFLFHLSCLFSLTLIIDIFNCLSHTSLLLHVITTHLVSHLPLSSIIFSISALIIGIFYCIDRISLLLHLIITLLVIDFIITM